MHPATENISIHLSQPRLQPLTANAQSHRTRQEVISIKMIIAAVVFLRGVMRGECFFGQCSLVLVPCRFSLCPPPPSFLKQHAAAGWRSRQRQQIRRTQERGENGGGRGACTPWPQSTMSYLVLCPPLSLSAVHGCGAFLRRFLLPAEMEICDSFFFVTVGWVDIVLFRVCFSSFEG